MLYQLSYARGKERTIANRGCAGVAGSVDWRGPLWAS